MDSKTVISRRTAIGAALVAASPLFFPGRVRAQGTAAHADTFVILLDGPYQPVVHGPNLGLSAVDLSDGSYSTTKIYPVSGTPGNTNQNKASGDFYVQRDLRASSTRSRIAARNLFPLALTCTRRRSWRSDAHWGQRPGESVRCRAHNLRTGIWPPPVFA